MERLTGKTALLTGGAGGLGLETARLFLNEGARVAIVDVNAAALHEADAGEWSSDRLIRLQGDVTNEADVTAFVQATVDAFGTIDVFFNNAGIEGRVAEIVNTNAEDFDRVQRINVTGVFLGLKHVLPHMYAQKSGSIINTSSVAGLHATAGLAPYVTSKHAVIGLTKTAALEAAPHGVRVNSIHPSAANTRMMRSLEAGLSPDDPEAIRTLTAQGIPLGRYAEAIDIARLVLFLGSDESNFITAAQYRVDGGMGAH